MITSRQQRILTQLMDAREYIPLQSIAEEYEISMRTLRNDLLQLEDLLRERGVMLERNRLQGVRLQLDPKQSEILAEQIRERPIYMDAKQRSTLLLKRLLQETNIGMNHILDEYEISKNTLLLDLNGIKPWLVGRKLELHKDRGILSIRGSEQLKRSAYLELLLAEITDDKLLRYMLDQQSDSDLSRSTWNFWFKAEDAQMLFDTISRLEQLLGVQFTDAGYSTLTLHLLMAMERLKNNHAIEMDEASLHELEQSHVYLVVQSEILPDIERHFGVQLPAAEVGYITQHVLGAQKQNIAADSEIFMELAKQIVLRSERALGRPLQMMEQIIQGLVIHLKPAVYRAKFGLQSKNPLMQQLEVQYGTNLSMLEEIVNDVVSPLSVKLDRDEIGYIMMHIGSGMTMHSPPVRKRVAIVCGSGLGTSAIMKRQISVIFPQVDVVDTYSYKDTINIDSHIADAVLTTIEISHPMHVPWLHVSPLLTEHDQRKVASFLGVSAVAEAATATAMGIVNDIYRIVEQNAQIINRNKLLEQLLLLFQGGSLQQVKRAHTLSELLAVNAISLQLDGTDWRSAIRFGNRLLIDSGASTVAYEDKLVEMVTSGKHSFIIHQGVAFPHAYMPKEIQQTAFSLMTFREPISFGPGGQSVWLIITLAAVDKERHVAALGTLLDALNDEVFMQELRLASDPQQVWQRLQEKEEP